MIIHQFLGESILFTLCESLVYYHLSEHCHRYKPWTWFLLNKIFNNFYYFWFTFSCTSKDRFLFKVVQFIYFWRNLIASKIKYSAVSIPQLNDMFPMYLDVNMHPQQHLLTVVCSICMNAFYLLYVHPSYIATGLNIELNFYKINFSFNFVISLYLNKKCTEPAYINWT